MENNENQNGNMENINMETMMKLMQSNQMGNSNSGIQDKNQMLEAFILFQKFMNMNQMLDQHKEIIKNEISKNESQTSQSNNNNFIIESKNINNNINNNNINNNNNNNKETEIKKDEQLENNSIINTNQETNKENNQIVKQDKKEVIKPRIRRGENKNIELEKKEKDEIKDPTTEKKENIESNIEKIQQPKNQIDESQNKIIENENNSKEIKEIKEITQEEKIEPKNNNITKEEEETNIENNNSDPFEKKLPTIKNFDDIPIKSGGNNFMDLLEKNLENEKNLPQQNIQNKPIRKYTPNKYKKQIEISKPQKGEMKKYKYYTDNFDEANPYNDRMNREEKAKQAKEKAREIENKQKLKIEKKNEIEKKILINLNFLKILEIIIVGILIIKVKIKKMMEMI